MKIIFIYEGKMESVVYQIHHQYQMMGPAEKRIADYLFNHSNEIVGISISELAALCDCGDATIVRFARRIGLTGYQELKIRVATEMNSSSEIEKEIQKEDSCFQIFQKRELAIYDALKKTETVLDPQKLDQVAHLIMGASRTVIFGLGNSASIAQDAAHKLMRLGLDAQACNDNHLQAIIASHLRRGSVAIGISHSGASKDIIEAMRLCKIWGATTVCITNYGKSPLSEVTDIALFTQSEETDFSILALNSRIAQLAIIDSIYTYIVLHAEKESKQAIYNTEIALQSKKF